MGYSAGGSSSGSAVLVALGEVDMALGGDQGGSIRMPASFCGIYGMKPTHGLVPYTGIMPIEIYVDHTGPMTANVADNALLLEVLAGPDGYDSRQYNVKTHPYTKALQGDVKGMKIGLVKEGFAQANAEADVNAKVKAAAQEVRSAGRHGERGLDPHAPGGAGAVDADRHRGPDPDHDVGRRLRRQPAGSLRHQPDGLPPQLAQPRQRAVGDHQALHHVRHLHPQLLRQPLLRQGDEHQTRLLTAAYDAALAEYDLLMMPTTPIKATELPPPDAPRELYVERALNMISNTAPFDITHHPAMAVPCGMSDGLPVSLMLVGKHFDEPTIYKAAFAFEQAGDWKKM